MPRTEGLAPTQALFRLDTVSVYDCQPRYSWPRHRHPDYELLVCCQGLYRCRVNDRAIDVHPGHGLLIQPGDWHEDHCPEPLYFLSLTFHQVDERSLLLDADIDPRRRCPAIDIDGFSTCHAALMGTYDSERSFMPQEQDALLQACVWHYLGCLPEGLLGGGLTRDPRIDSFERRLLACFDRHLTSSCSAERIAKELGMSRRSLEERCRQAFDESPARLLKHRRFERARRLLKQSDAPIAEIAAAFGFNDPAQFTRGYREVFACAPSADRGDD